MQSFRRFILTQIHEVQSVEDIMNVRESGSLYLGRQLVSVRRKIKSRGNVKSGDFRKEYTGGKLLLYYDASYLFPRKLCLFDKINYKHTTVRFFFF